MIARLRLWLALRKRKAIRKVESTIIGHVKHRFGVQLDSKDLARIKRDMPRKYIQGQGRPSGWERGAEGDGLNFKPKRYDDLAVKIAKHHPRIVERLKANHVAKYGRAAR
ncbi:MAG: hypothetical protein IPM41_16240 [Sphingomonadales bacterium]|nr:hypothetical protein [Sphingomonadales bacterium]